MCFPFCEEEEEEEADVDVDVDAYVDFDVDAYVDFDVEVDVDVDADAAEYEVVAITGKRLTKRRTRPRRKSSERPFRGGLLEEVLRCWCG